MKAFTLSIFLFLYILSVKCEEETDLVKDHDLRGLMWENLFLKLDAVLSETERLSQNLNDVNNRLDDLNERQKAQEDQLSKLINNVEEIQTDVQWVFNAQMYSSSQWTLILRRTESSTKFFYRNWNEYRQGFGEPKGNFFVGLQWLHNMTTSGPLQEIQIVLTDIIGHKFYSRHDLFRIGDETEKYAIKELGQYSGNAGDLLLEHLGHKFSTFDQDNDDNNRKNCALDYESAWWFFESCTIPYINGPHRRNERISFQPWIGRDRILEHIEIFIRPRLV